MFGILCNLTQWMWWIFVLSFVWKNFVAFKSMPYRLDWLSPLVVYLVCFRILYNKHSKSWFKYKYAILSLCTNDPNTHTHTSFRLADKTFLNLTTFKILTSYMITQILKLFPLAYQTFDNFPKWRCKATISRSFCSKLNRNKSMWKNTHKWIKDLEGNPNRWMQNIWNFILGLGHSVMCTITCSLLHGGL